MPRGRSDGDTGQSVEEVAAYISDLTADLARMARRHRLEALGYLLDMARLEALHARGMVDVEKRQS
jgi:hypothetical protein